MKRILAVVSLILCSPFYSGTGYAAIKCVPLGSGTSCRTADLSSLSFKVGWETSCSNSNNNNEDISISGIAACSSSSGTYGSTSRRISTGNVSDTNPASTNDNKYCWCRIIQPAVSDWMFLGNFSTASSCHYQCAIACGESIGQSSTISLYGTFY